MKKKYILLFNDFQKVERIRITLETFKMLNNVDIAFYQKY